MKYFIDYGVNFIENSKAWLPLSNFWLLARGSQGKPKEEQMTLMEAKKPRVFSHKLMLSSKPDFKFKYRVRQ